MYNEKYIFSQIADLLPRRADVNFLDHIQFEREAIYIMDRGYVHFKRLYTIHKQHLKIQVFWGYSFNAVKTQICVAISSFLLVAMAKKQLKVKQNLYGILQILQVSQFEKIALPRLISATRLHFPEKEEQKQLNLAIF